MKVHHDIPTEEVQIQIIPLIDVIFCILTFFILAALQLTRQQAISVDLPKASTGTTQMREMMVVTISPTGQTFVDKQLVDRTSLQQILGDYLQQNPSGLLVLNASQTALYNDVVQVLDILRSVGGDRVALATLPADASTPGASPTVPNLFPTPTPTTTFDPANPFSLPSPVPTSPVLPSDGGLTPNSPGVPTAPGSSSESLPLDRSATP